MAMEHFTTSIKGAVALLAEKLPGAEGRPLHLKRNDALAALLEHGIPTVRHEEWKYTNLAPVMALDFVPTIGTPEPPSTRLLENIPQIASDAWRIVIVNGVVQLHLSTPPDGDANCTVRALTDELVATDAIVGTMLGSIAPASSHPFVAANAALTTSGVIIHVHGTVERPIEITSLVDTTIGNTFCAPRILVIADRNASATIIETHHTVGGRKGLSASVTELQCAEGSKVSIIKILDDAPNGHHIGMTAANIARSATATATTVCMQGAFMRNDCVMRLCEPGAEAYLYGVSVLSGTEFADNHTVVDHLQPHCHSEELYKGIYDERSTGVFNGKIFVRQDAQKTTAYQSNHTLLLSDNATVNAKPQLEIWADDVKCSHGATSGQLDEEAVFYLQSRGLSKDDARGMLTYAFAADVAERIANADVRDHVEQRIAEKLGARRFEH